MKENVILLKSGIKKFRCECKNFIEEKKTFDILLTFLLTTITLLIAVSIYCHLINYRGKKHLLPFHITNNELK